MTASQTTLSPVRRPRLDLRFVAASAALLALTGAAVFTGDVPPAHAARVNATCNNTTTDAATIQAAINSSAAGDEIVIKGPCLINAIISLADDRTYRGDGTGTVLKQANGANLKAMLASQPWVNNNSWVGGGVRIERLTLDGNSANNTGTTPLVLQTWDSRVYDIRVYNAPADGILLTTTTSNGTPITNTAVNNILSDLYIESTGGAGIHGNDPNNFLTDNVIERSWITGTAGSAVATDNAAGWQIRNLHLYDITKNAIDANRCYNTGIHDNYIEDFGSQGTSGTTYYGIRCTVQDKAPSSISGNTINQFGTFPGTGTFVYIGLDGVNDAGTGFVSVTGNGILGRGTTRETGLNYQKGGGTALTVASTGNVVTSVGTVRTVGTGVTVSAGV
jgi:Right handed beta helix region